MVEMTEKGGSRKRRITTQDRDMGRGGETIMGDRNLSTHDTGQLGLMTTILERETQGTPGTEIRETKTLETPGTTRTKTPETTETQETEKTQELAAITMRTMTMTMTTMTITAGHPM
jgi:hypothetical protein